MVTIECKEDMERAFPAVCVAYRDRLAAEARAKAEQKELDRALAKKQREEQKELAKKQREEQKELDRALAKKQREEQKELDRALAKKQREEKRAARKANKSPPKMPVPTSPSSHPSQVLHQLTLASPTSDSLQTTQPSFALHRHLCSNTVQQTENTYMYVDLDSSTESNAEEVPTTSLRERISARKLTLCSASQDQLIQTSLSTAQSVCKASQRSNSPSQCDVWARVSTSDEQPTMSPTKRDGLTLICHPSPKRLSLSASSDDKVNSVMGKGTAYDPIVL
jgi:myosin heavy subunit